VVDPRFNHLLELARNGDEASVAQLWHEFGFDFHAECQPSDSLGCSSSAEQSDDNLRMQIVNEENGSPGGENSSCGGISC
jgi:hypothetical protein